MSAKSNRGQDGVPFSLPYFYSQCQNDILFFYWEEKGILSAAFDNLMLLLWQ